MTSRKIARESVARTAKRNRFIQLTGATKQVNRELETRARAPAGLKGYITNLAACPDGMPVTAEFVIGACHQHQAANLPVLIADSFAGPWRYGPS